MASPSPAPASIPSDFPAASRREGVLSWLVASGAALLVLAFAGFLACTMDRGFSSTDEGFYFLTAQHPRDVTIWPDSAHYYASLLYRAAGGSIVGFRLLSLAALLGSAVGLGFGLDALLRSTSLRHGPERAATLLSVSFVTMGQLAYYLWFLRGASYNSLAAISTNVTLGLLLALFARPAAAAPTLALPGIGFALGVLFFSKPPAFFGAAFCVAAALGLAPAFAGGRLRGARAVAGGLVVEFLFHFVFFESPATWFHVLRDGLLSSFLLTPNYDPHRVIHYAEEVIRTFHWALSVDKGLLLAAVIGFLAVGRLPLSEGMRYRLLGAGAGGLFLFSLVSLARHHHFEVPKAAEDPSAAVVGLCFLWLVLAGTVASGAVLYRLWQKAPLDVGRREGITLLLAAALCFLIPLGDVIGTSRPLTMTLAWYLAPWFALLFLLLACASRLLRSSVPLALGVLLLSGVVCREGYRIGWNEPYRMQTGLPGQDVPTALGSPPRTVRLDAATSAFIGQLREAARSHGFTPGDDVINLGHTPELVFFLGARSPALPFWLSGYPGYREFARFALLRIAPERLRKAFILEQADAVATSPPLTEFGIRFPDDYLLCGTFFYPANRQEISLWKPR